MRTALADGSSANVPTPKGFAFAGTTMTVLVSGEETGGAFAVLHVIKPSGSSTPPHSHDRDAETIYVLSGVAKAETESRIVELKEGEVLCLPAERPHRLFNDVGAAAREFLLCTPAGFDRFVAAAGTPVEPYAEPRPGVTEDERRRLVEAAPRFGVRLLRSAHPKGAALDVAMPEPERWDVMGTRIDVLARLGSDDGDLVLLREVLPPGRSVPLHSHVDLECFFVINGSLALYREDAPGAENWLTLGRDEVALVGPNVRHAIRNSGSVPADFLVVATVRMARFMTAVGSLATAGAVPRLPNPAELAASVRCAAEYGYWLASPPENAAIGIAVPG